MRRYRVRSVQVVRVWAYALPLSLPWATIVYAVAYNAVALLGWPSDAGLISSWLLLPVIGTHALRSVGLGYKHYLRMDHGWAVAVASLAMGFLAGGVLCNFLFSNSFSFMVWQLLNIFGWN